MQRKPILIGFVVVALAVSAVGSLVATQFAAAHLGYPKQLGEPVTIADFRLDASLVVDGLGFRLRAVRAGHLPDGEDDRVVGPPRHAGSRCSENLASLGCDTVDGRSVGSRPDAADGPASDDRSPSASRRFRLRSAPPPHGPTL
jgi:hypothetical protein